MSDAQQRIDEIVKSSNVLLFMKGNASFPMCGFSGRAIQILKACGVDGKEIKTVNVLDDEEVRQWRTAQRTTAGGRRHGHGTIAG